MWEDKAPYRELMNQYYKTVQRFSIQSILDLEALIYKAQKAYKLGNFVPTGYML